MDHGGNALAPSGPYVTSDGHEAAGVPVDRIDVEHVAGLLHRNGGCERHELGAIEPPVEEVVRLAATRIGEDRPSTERARSIFHSPRIDRTDLAASEALRSCRDRIARKPPDPGRRRKIVVSRLAVIAAQINIGQSAALTEPVCGTVALKQIGECPAYRQSFVPHRREYEDFGDAELFGQH